ncbi:MAG: bifunctional folylpolyglutamate synthase/dihydrofolate synthase, partial [Proteobacteria bacterium]|nr:bifunctional folylpolyglutamate synthase/dihydrofolate synthase [Pseudomonadota bacterium]
MTPKPSSTSGKKTLQQWLQWQELLHPSEIDLGLERVQQVIQLLLPEYLNNTTQHFPFKIITIAGTNGKGSSVAMLESILSQAGYNVGSYTSPHLLNYNERIKINQQSVSDKLICQAFERIDSARGEISLTYFEFATLAAIDIFCQPNSISTEKRLFCDVVILEVGLGGRLDAVNVIDPDVALVTTVDIDHQDWLGSDINTIAMEKAGVFRHDKPAIYGDNDLPESIANKVIEDDLEFYQFGEDYCFELDATQWHWQILSQYPKLESRDALSFPGLKGKIQLKNASNVLMVLELLKQSLPVSQQDINLGLSRLNLAGRFQILASENEPLRNTPIIFDVAHNEQAAKSLRFSIEEYMNSDDDIKSSCSATQLHVIIGMLKDKEIAKVLDVFKDI